MSFDSKVPGVQILAKVSPQQAELLTPEALGFLATLHRAFNSTRKRLLIERQLRETRIVSGELPDFLPHTKHVRDDLNWRAAPPAPGLTDRRVEITGPVDRKMVINALNSGASTFMADFEDSNTPTWQNNLSGQLNMRDAIHRRISYTAPNGKKYNLRQDGKVAVLLVRPRGWHLEEKHVLIDGEPCSGSIFDFAIYFFHNAKKSIEIGNGPYFYLPKLESHLEARLWNDVFNLAQDTIGIPRGTIRGTVLIETILAAFEMDEIIFELREHSSGLNCGRWDYIFSFIKKFRHDSRFILPDRSDVMMTTPFMSAYVKLLIKTCHLRGVHAMGGMAAQIPIKNNDAANKAALEKVRVDKTREVTLGHDGTWVAHPDLVPLAKAVFDQHMPYANQLFKLKQDVVIKASDLIDPQTNGKITMTGIRANVVVSLKYMESWLRGLGCVPINNLMEDAATAEISRSQLWQWCKHGSVTDCGTKVDKALLLLILKEELDKIEATYGSKFSQGKWQLAYKKLSTQITGEDYCDFLPSLCYDDVCEIAVPSKL